ncbi:MAG: hypothetical protein FWG47_05660, partial [Propionibacteriaceae bacterium]|nr:hypothetical protein [Propionibacteriaceae bacterium]
MEEHSNVIIKPKLRHGADLVVLFFLVGFFLLGFAALMIATGFVERLNVAMAQVNRFESIDSYPGRPEPAAATGSSQINYLLLASDSQKDLHAAMVLNVSSDRNKLTLLV